MVTIATHILNKYLPNKTLPTYTFLSCKQLTKLLQQQYKKTGHSPLNTTISQHLVKIHLIGEQIQNISDLQSADIINIYSLREFPAQHFCNRGVKSCQYSLIVVESSDLLRFNLQNIDT